MSTKTTTRNIALTPKLDRYVQGKIDSGRYQSASEVVREGLRLLEQQEQERAAALIDIRKQIRLGYTQVLKGQTVDPDAVLGEIAKLKAARHRASKKSQ